MTCESYIYERDSFSVSVRRSNNVTGNPVSEVNGVFPAPAETGCADGEGGRGIGLAEGREKRYDFWHGN